MTVKKGIPFLQFFLALTHGKILPGRPLGAFPRPTPCRRAHARRNELKYQNRTFVFHGRGGGVVGGLSPLSPYVATPQLGTKQASLRNSLRARGNRRNRVL